MSAVLQPTEARLEPLNLARIDAVCAVELMAYSHPWTRANFIDSLAAGYHCQCIVGPAMGPTSVALSLPCAGAPAGAGAASAAGHSDAGWAVDDTLIGYFVAMKGVDEVHLLNLTVAPAFQRQGWAPLLLDALAGWSRGQGAQWLWLEVRQSNQRALDVYLRHGFRQVGQRKGYYPADGGQREDAVVMSLRLPEPGGAKGRSA